MSNLGLLVKTNLRNTLGINQMKHSSNKGKSLRYLFAGGGSIAAIVIVGALVCLYFSIMAMALKEFGMIDFLIVISAATCVLVSFFTSIYKAQGALFGSKDLQMLMTLPINSGTILASKVIELLIINYLFVAVVTIPSSIIYFLNTDASPLIFLYTVAGTIFLPLLSIVLASVLGYFLSFISSRTKHKNMASIVLNILLVLAIMAASTNINKIANYVLLNSSSIISGIKRLCPPAYYYYDCVVNLSALSLIKLVLWSVIPFVLFSAVFGKSFGKITSRLTESYKAANYKMEELEVSSCTMALFKKEVKKLFSSPVYFINCCIGAMLSVIAAVVALVLGGDGFLKIMLHINDAELADNMAEQMASAIPQLQSIIQLLPIVVMVFCTSLTCTTAVSFSLEGINLWILKSSPIRPKDIFKGKIGLNLAILLPVILIDTVLFSIALKLKVGIIIFTVLIPVLLAVYISVMGLIINLYLPKLVWTSETQVVKQSASAFFGYFEGFIVIAICCLVCFMNYKVFSITNLFVHLSIVSLILLLFNALAFIILRRKGDELYYKLGC